MIDRLLLERILLERTWLERVVLGRIADLVLGAPRRVLAAFAVLVVAGGLYGFDAARRLSPAGYEVGGSESTAAQALLAEEFDTGPTNLVVLATAKAGTDDPAGVDGVAATVAGRELTDRLAARPDLADVSSYWATGAPHLRSDDGMAALIAARIVASEDDVYARAEEIRHDLAGPIGPLEVQIGGSAAANPWSRSSPST